MYIDRNPQGNITLSQHIYCKQLLKWFNIESCLLATTSLSPSLILLIENYSTIPDETDEMKNIPFHKALGSLMWLQVATRPDLAFSVNKLAHFSYNLGRAHWNAVKYVLAYVKGMIDYDITYKGGSSFQLHRYVDSDYAGCKDT